MLRLIHSCVVLVAIAAACATVPEGLVFQGATADLGQMADVQLSPDLGNGGAGGSPSSCAVVGQPRCACASPGDCDNGLCVDSAEGKTCATTCTTDAACRADETCVQATAAAGDVFSVCASRFASLCAPCKTDADCRQGIFAGLPMCVEAGDAGSYCTGACDDQTLCPAGFDCKGSPGRCRPTSGSCACTPWAVAHASTTDCKSSNAAGTCGAPRICSSPGPWPPCLPKEAVAESCNGLDDNCDGLTDNGADASCSDGDLCTDDTCVGGGCTHIDAHVCGDGECASACGETLAECPIDCHTCGLPDFVCSPGESPYDCPEDCCGGCGDGKCTGYNCGENSSNCSTDCGSACGNGSCDKGENPSSCLADCKVGVCGNHVCEASDGGVTQCPQDCATSCGNCFCDKGEDFLSCPVDCGFCGDGLCSLCSTLGESPKTCPLDCGSPPACDGMWSAFCNDGSPCTEDNCQVGKGCTHVPGQATPCDDKNACTSGDQCLAGACAGSAMVNCGDGNVCTTDSCAPKSGCTYASADGTPCSDGDDCTLGDACAAAACGAGGLMACSDGNACTADACAGGNCTHAAVAAPCSDGNLCTIADTCSGGTCTGSPMKCDDSNGCTADSCASGSCKFLPIGLVCDDGNACTSGDVCTGGTCGGVAVKCEDGNSCTADSCIGGACKSVPNTASCSDGDPCTNSDVCSGGKCAGIAVTCNDNNGCTVDYCSGGTCTYEPKTVLCNDGNACTVSDVCTNGICAGTLQPEICDGVDNNCKGGKDEGFSWNGLAVGASCTQGVGACKQTGKVICASASAATCSVTGGAAQNWGTQPAANGSWDLNCDGVVVKDTTVEWVTTATCDTTPWKLCGAASQNTLCRHYDGTAACWNGGKKHVVGCGSSACGATAISFPCGAGGDGSWCAGCNNSNSSATTFTIKCK